MPLLDKLPINFAQNDRDLLLLAMDNTSSSTNSRGLVLV